MAKETFKGDCPFCSVSQDFVDRLEEDARMAGIELQGPAIAVTPEREFVGGYAGLMDVAVCQHCGCISGTLYRGELGRVVISQFVDGPVADEDIIPFDLTILGSDGVSRFHGTLDRVSRRVVQTG